MEGDVVVVVVVVVYIVVTRRVWSGRWALWCRTTAKGKKGMFALETCPRRRRILREIKYLVWPVIRYNKVADKKKTTRI